MSDDHDLYSEWAAAYTLGALDTDDRKTFERHMASCSICTAELAALSPLPGLIAKIEPSDIDHHASAARAAAVQTAATAELAGMQRRTRRWQFASVAATAAAAVLAVVLLRVDPSDSGPSPVIATVVASQADTTLVTTTAHQSGTIINVEITGLPRRDSYNLWAIDHSGEWSNAADWPASPDGSAFLVGATTFAVDDIDRIVITSTEIDDVLVDTTA